MNSSKINYVAFCLLILCLAMTGHADPLPITPPLQAKGVEIERPKLPPAQALVYPRLSEQQADRIRVERLGSLARAAIGTHTKWHQNIWQNADGEDLMSLLSGNLPRAAPAPIEALERDLLLAAAYPPPGAGENWFLLRVNRLLALGETKHVIALIEQTDGAKQNLQILYILTQAQLADGQYDMACQQQNRSPRQIIEQERQPLTAQQQRQNALFLFFQKLKIFCLLHDQEFQEASTQIELGLDYFERDKVFYDLAFSLATQTALPEPLNLPPRLSILHYLLLRIGSYQFPPRLNVYPPALYNQIAHDEVLPFILRYRALLARIHADPQNAYRLHQQAAIPYHQPVNAEAADTVTEEINVGQEVLIDHDYARFEDYRQRLFAAPNTAQKQVYLAAALQIALKHDFWFAALKLCELQILLLPDDPASAYHPLISFARLSLDHNKFLLDLKTNPSPFSLPPAPEIIINIQARYQELQDKLIAFDQSKQSLSLTDRWLQLTANTDNITIEKDKTKLKTTSHSGDYRIRKIRQLAEYNRESEVLIYLTNIYRSPRTNNFSQDEFLSTLAPLKQIQAEPYIATLTHDYVISATLDDDPFASLWPIVKADLEAVNTGAPLIDIVTDTVPNTVIDTNDISPTN